MKSFCHKVVRQQSNSNTMLNSSLKFHNFFNQSSLHSRKITGEKMQEKEAKL